MEAHAKHDALNDPQVETKAKKMLRGLGYRDTDFDRPAREMSGGWIMRARLARLLVMEPDLLLLDEPTNHLDLLSLLWLQNYLKNYSGALLLISHDRQFMDEVVEQVHEISEKKLIAYTGNYTDLPAAARGTIRAAAGRLQKPAEGNPGAPGIRRSLPRRRLQGLAGHEQAQADRAHGADREAAAAAQAVPLPDSAAAARRAARRHARRTFTWPTARTQVYRGLDLDHRTRRTHRAGRAERRRQIHAAEDSRRRGANFRRANANLGHNAKIGYFSQHRADTLDPEQDRARGGAWPARPRMREDEARGILGSFLFRKDEIYKKTAVLSGGEKSRLNLVKFLVDPPNLLLMDEPTTHLDIHTVESLTLALERYEGTLVFISHDVHFIRQLATKVLHVNAGQVTPYVGGYDYFLEKTGTADDARAALTAG